jgi:hypothetical protein
MALEVCSDDDEEGARKYRPKGGEDVELLSSLTVMQIVVHVCVWEIEQLLLYHIYLIS